jgi:hypothetical protein
VSQLLETVGPRTGPAPLVYTLAELGTVDVQSIFAHFDGTSASGSFRPTVTVRSQNGTIVSRTFPPDTTLSAGDSADVTFAPLLRAASAAGGLPTYNALVLAEPTLGYYYECGEATGNLVDSKSAQNLVPVGAPTYGLGGPIPPATAVGVAGTANYWEVAPANPDSFFGNVHAFSIEGFLLVAPSGSANDPLFNFNLGGTQIDLGTTFAAKQLSLQRGAVQTPLAAASAVTTNVWNYVAGTFDGANLRCYLNGVLVGGPTATGTNLGSLAGGVQAIGARGNPRSAYLNGRAANVAVYGSALSDATIMAHYLRWLGVA